MKLRHIVSVLLAISLLAPVARAAPSQPPGSAGGKLIMLVVDKVSYADLWQHGGPNLRRVLADGALGLMNANSGGSFRDCGSYLTIGAGNYAVCSAAGIHAERRLDFTPAGQPVVAEGLINRDFENLIRANEQLNRPVKVGLLGSLLGERGIKTALVGTEGGWQLGDMDQARAALITMDDQGCTDFGRIGEALLRPTYGLPGGSGTDYQALWAAYEKARERADFIVIQTGDSFRLNENRQLSASEREQAKAVVFDNMDPFIGQLIDSLEQDSLLLITVPFPAEENIAAGQKLTPIIAYGQAVPRGLLSSATTKRSGIITNTDLTGEAVHFFGLRRDPALAGRQLQYLEHTNPAAAVQYIEQVAVFNYRYRAPLVSGFVGLMVLLLLAYGVSTCGNTCYLIYLKPALVAGLLLPTVFLLLPLFKPWDLVLFIALALLLAAGVGLTLAFSRDQVQAVGVFLLLSAALIVADTAFGNPLMKVSILGYDPIIGARFYGIGNEYMGFLLGATLMGSASLLQSYRLSPRAAGLAAGAVSTVVVVCLALPGLGTNVGGAMAAFFGFGTFLLLLFKGEITTKDLAGTGLTLLLFLILLFHFDSGRPLEQQSHIGQFGSLVRQQGLVPLLQVIKRKLLLNYRLIKYSAWTRILVAMAVALLAVFKWPLEIAEQIYEHYPYISYAALAGMVGTAAALLFNDSGVVAAATCILPVGITLLLAAHSRP